MKKEFMMAVAALTLAATACKQGECPECYIPPTIKQPPQVETRDRCSVEFTFSLFRPQPPEEGTDETDTTLNPGTRAVNETELAEVHFYLFGPENVYRRVTPFSTVPLQLELPVGKYALYAVANKGGIGRETTELELYDLVFDRSELTDRLVMSCREDIVVSKELRSKDVALAHSAVKIQYIISNIVYMPVRVESVQLCNLPDKGYAFDDGLQLPGDIFNDAEPKLFVDTPLIVSGTFYMPENLSGNVSAITSPYERHNDSAPPTATYLHIRTRHMSQPMDYYVYLGGNQTDDFNVRRGMSYRYSISVRGREHSDMRVSVRTEPITRPLI